MKNIAYLVSLLDALEQNEQDAIKFLKSCYARKEYACSYGTEFVKGVEEGTMPIGIIGLDVDCSALSALLDEVHLAAEMHGDQATADKAQTILNTLKHWRTKQEEK